MRFVRPLLLTLLGLLLLSPATAATAEGATDANLEERPASTGTIRLPFAAREWLDVDLDVHGVSVDRLKLRQARAVKSLFLSHDEANRGQIAVTNGTDRKIHPSVAVAVFDGEGRLLAAANTGKKVFAIKPGVTKELDIHFGGVFQHIGRGAWLYVTLEY
jgi:hypothetical protein